MNLSNFRVISLLIIGLNISVGAHWIDRFLFAPRHYAPTVFLHDTYALRIGNHIYQTLYRYPNIPFLDSERMDNMLKQNEKFQMNWVAIEVLDWDAKNWWKTLLSTRVYQSLENAETKIHDSRNLQAASETIDLKMFLLPENAESEPSKKLNWWKRVQNKLRGISFKKIRSKFHRKDAVNQLFNTEKGLYIKFVPTVHRRRARIQRHLIWLHGNAEDVIHLRLTMQSIADSTRMNVYGVEYPGYSFLQYHNQTQRNPRPCQARVLASARAVLRHLIKNENIPMHQVFIYGFSLGAALAVDLAAGLSLAEQTTRNAKSVETSLPWLQLLDDSSDDENDSFYTASSSTDSPSEASKFQLRGLILDAPFSSLTAMVQRFTLIPPRLNRFLLPANSLDSRDKIKSIACPTLHLRREDDRLVPFRQSEELRQLHSDPKLVTTCDLMEGGHSFNVWFHDKTLNCLLDFLDRH